MGSLLTHPSVEKEVDLLHSHMQQPKEKPQVQLSRQLASLSLSLLQDYKRREGASPVTTSDIILHTSKKYDNKYIFSLEYIFFYFEQPM